MIKNSTKINIDKNLLHNSVNHSNRIDTKMLVVNLYTSEYEKILNLYT